LSSM